MRRERSPLSDAIRGCTSAFALSFFINVTLLVSPLYSLQIYDRVLSSRNTTTLALLTLIVLAFLALYGVLEYARSGILIRSGVIFEKKLRRPLFDSMMRAELAPQARQGQQVIRDAESIRECISNGTVSTLFDLPWTHADHRYAPAADPRACDKLLVMSMGAMVAFGPREEVIARVRGNRVAAVEQQRAAQVAQG